MLASSLPERSRVVLATNGHVLSRSFDAGQRSREISLRSIERKLGKLDPSAWEFGLFETSDGRVRTSSVDEGGLNIWSVRFSEPDSTVPGRDWIVEVTSSTGDSRSTLSCRLSCYSRTSNFLFIPSTPGLLKEIVSAMAFFNGRFPFHEAVQTIESDEDLDRLFAELTDQSRWWNSIVVSESADGAFGVQPEKLAKLLMGVANVYFLPIRMFQNFERLVGFDFRVFGGGARSFRAGFSTSLSSPGNHPVIKAPPRENEWLVDRANHVLASDAFAASLRRNDFRKGAPSFLDIHQMATYSKWSKLEAQSNVSSDPEKAALRDALKANREELESMFELSSQVDRDLIEVRDDAETLRKQNFDLSQRILLLENAIKAGSVLPPTVRPRNYDEISKWIRTEFAGRIAITGRAERSLKEALYENIDHAIEAIELLGREYVDMKRSLITKEAFDESLKRLGLDLSGSITASRAGEQGDEYFIRYNGQRTFIDSHLRRGNSHDPRKSMRVYFFFDEDSMEVVLCYLPGHLDNRLT